MKELKEQLPSIDRAKIWRPENPTFTRARVLVAVYDKEDAQRAYTEGLLWRCQLLACEPYAEAQPQQCFNCWKWGHQQRFCKAKQTCGTCGTTPHTDGEPCSRQPRCAGCGGAHSARDRNCPLAQKA